MGLSEDRARSPNLGILIGKIMIIYDDIIYNNPLELGVTNS
jgi:hypothetical protein